MNVIPIQRAIAAKISEDDDALILVFERGNPEAESKAVTLLQIPDFEGWAGPAIRSWRQHACRYLVIAGFSEKTDTHPWVRFSNDVPTLVRIIEETCDAMNAVAVPTCGWGMYLSGAALEAMERVISIRYVIVNREAPGRGGTA